MQLVRGLMGWRRELDPGSFALVMATGIVSIGLQQLGLSELAQLLFAINLLAYALLVAMSVWRFAGCRPQMVADFCRAEKGVGFLTFVAGSCVLGNQSLQVVDWPVLAAVFLVIGVLSWGLLLYFFLLVAITRRHKAAVNDSLHAGWLIIVVSTQAVAILMAEFVARLPLYADWLALAAISLFLSGVVWYVILIVLLTYRMVFKHFAVQDLTPPYWINMGALAITTLAGCMLVRHVVPLDFYLALRGFVEGLTLLSWAFASWWIPLLLLLGVWRHLYCRVPLRYHVGNWNIVFPLGMYTVCTLALSRMLEAPFLMVIPEVSVYISLAAWLLVFVGALRVARRQVC